MRKPRQLEGLRVVYDADDVGEADHADLREEVRCDLSGSAIGIIAATCAPLVWVVLRVDPYSTIHHQAEAAVDKPRAVHAREQHRVGEAAEEILTRAREGRPQNAAVHRAEQRPDWAGGRV